MITLEINNSYSQIKGIDLSNFNKLRKVLSYTPNPQAAYFSGGFIRPKYLIDKKGYFPSGLLYKVSEFLQENNLEHKFTKFRQVPKSKIGMFKLQTTHKPYEDQENAASAALAMQCGGIQLPTGCGKSLVIALIAAKLNVKTLVVVPSLEIKKQLTLSLLDALGVNPNIVVENIDSRALQTMTGFDCLIIDEAHHVAAKTYYKLNKTAWKGIYYRFYLTATFYRNDDSEHLLFEGIAGRLIYELSIKEAIKKRYIVPIEAYYYDLQKTKTEAYTWKQVYSELVVNNEARNELIAVTMLRLNAEMRPTLCLVKEIAHGAILERLTGIPFANGQDETSRDYIRQFNSGKIKALIGTTGILGEGIDSKPAEYIIIAGLGKAKSAFLQNIGRGVRQYPGKASCKVILFRDKSHKFCLRHYNAQAKILGDELGIKPVLLKE